jgi:hypothetical protein
MNAICHSCGAVDPTGQAFRIERLPFRGARVYCPKCHKKLEEKVLLAVFGLNFVFALIGLITLWADPVSEVGYGFLNVSLLQLIILPSILIHEFAHGIAARLCGLTVPKIWIGRGKTLVRLKILGFDTEFKIMPVGGFTFLAGGSEKNPRFKYFISIIAGPIANVIILVIAWEFISWKNSSFERSVPWAALIAFTQAVILIENLLPYRIQTALGRISTDGLSLIQLLFSKSPDVLNSRIKVPSAQTRGLA